MLNPQSMMKLFLKPPSLLLKLPPLLLEPLLPPLRVRALLVALFPPLLPFNHPLQLLNLLTQSLLHKLTLKRNCNGMLQRSRN